MSVIYLIQAPIMKFHSWDKTSVIFRVQASSTIFIGVCHSYGLCMKDSVISVYRRLAHPSGVVKQVAW